MMSGDPAMIVEKAVSTLKVRDLLTVTLTRWTSVDSLTKTLPGETRRSAALAGSFRFNRIGAAPRATKLKAENQSPALHETRPPPTSIPFCRDPRLPRNVCPG